jgi:cell division protein FtsB
MKKTDINKIIYRVRNHYLTFNNVIILVAFLIAFGWLWGSLQVMQRNYALQWEVDSKRRQLVLTQLEKDNLELQKRYYQTNEYKEIAARESLGLVIPGEKMLILPPNSDPVKQADESAKRAPVATTTEPEESNLEQWMNFLFGGYSQSMQAAEEER